jgi:glycerophosphoryl diester phosphodiesterase
LLIATGRSDDRARLLMKAPNRPLIIAHRGESRDAPENTLAAIRLAWARGAQAVELDVRRTRDDHVVVIHDPDLRRVGRSRLTVGGSTAAALREIDIGAWKHPHWMGERVPLLKEVLATVPRGGRLFVEIKDGPEIVPALRPVMASVSLAPRQVIFMSFHPETVARAVSELPGYEACLLLTAQQWCARGGLARGIEAAHALGCGSLDVQTDRRLDRVVVEAVHDARLRLYVWTVNRVSTAQRLVAAGIDGITTDRCAWMSTQLRVGA